LTNGIIYGLIAIALVLIFMVTRILFIPQGEFVIFGALSDVLNFPLTTVFYGSGFIIGLKGFGKTVSGRDVIA
jgi:branched-subunit amino acid ABC-type transport system permease component